ncbi:hypothetical protein BDY21DRAFT_344343 [Lineolata rhizophorae]|uniref:Zn(2)-C6 fungal-type domain-containing protein n=1 Tax=Lineolata rhizophorae TaxID=578093 RepID=A0A6A6P0T4_9PEZI|nr:hypothetical protein BDY21DRAFT_344343 [Lineolata rhizophorae]
MSASTLDFCFYYFFLNIAADARVAYDSVASMSWAQSANIPCSHVQCDEGKPCQRCLKSNVTCTYNRPPRQRGPTSKHVQNALSLQSQTPLDPNLGLPIAPAPAPSYVQEATSPVIRVPDSAARLESIGPLDVVSLLIGDFFNFLYALHPFPEEAVLRERLRQRHDLMDARFVALVSSIVGATALACPRNARARLLDAQQFGPSADPASFVNRCQQVCYEARGPGYLASITLNEDDAATSYFLGLIEASRRRLSQSARYFSECITILSTTYQPNLTAHDSGRRVFWAAYMGLRMLVQMGSVPKSALAANISVPLPAETGVNAGFNMAVRIYASYWKLVLGEDSDSSLGRREALAESKKSLENVLLSVPPIPSAKYQQVDPALGGDVDGDTNFDIQRVHLWISALATRSYLVAKSINIDGADMHQERLDILREMLKLLGGVDRNCVEWNLWNLVSKAGQVISICIGESESFIAVGERVSGYINILDSIDSTTDEESRERLWETFSKYQEQPPISEGLNGDIERPVKRQRMENF